MEQENFAKFEVAFGPFEKETNPFRRVCPYIPSHTHVNLENLLPPGDPISPDPNAEPPPPSKKKVSILLPAYYGDTSWRNWETQFFFNADANGWNDVMRARKLVSSLKGHAAEVIPDLPCEDIACLVKFMREKFGHTHRSRFAHLPAQATKIEAVKNSCKKGCSNLLANKWCTKLLNQLPNKKKALLLCSQFIILILLCVALYGVLGKEALPGSEIFALTLLLVSAHIGGKIVKFVKLPPLIGMLVAGIIFRNIPYTNFYEDISIHWATTLRASALVVILIKAGLGLDGGKLKKLSLVVFQLAFMPCIVETIAAAVASHYILDLPWSWAVMLGFVVAAVSPAVIVPGLLSLEYKDYGVDKGIPTLVIAAASVDDILAITGFTVMLSITFSEGNEIMTLLKGILEPFGGLIVGGVIGRIFWEIPVQRYTSATVWVYYHIIMICLGAIGCMFVSKRLDFAGAGPMGCLVMAFVAGLGWKRDRWHMEGVNKIFVLIWRFAEPCLFSLIGAEVSVTDIQSNIGLTVAALSIGLVFRLLAASLATCGGDLNWKEKLFIAMAWLPKATVQAAIGPQALDVVISKNGDAEMVEYAHKILTSAVLCIIMTAPIGAALIAIFGPILLTKDDDDEEAPKLEEPKREESQPNEPKSKEKSVKQKESKCKQSKEKKVKYKETKLTESVEKATTSKEVNPKESEEKGTSSKNTKTTEIKLKESEDKNLIKESEEKYSISEELECKESEEKVSLSKEIKPKESEEFKESEEKCSSSNDGKPEECEGKGEKSIEIEETCLTSKENKHEECGEQSNETEETNFISKESKENNARSEEAKENDTDNSV